jgi:preprotein translocase subunit Sec61beta
MARKDKIYMPMGTGGLMRYSEEEKVLFKVKPMWVVYLVIVLAAIEIIAKFIAG